MKKAIVILLATLALCGCTSGSGGKKNTTVVCKIGEGYATYKSAEITYIGKDDIVEEFSVVGVIELPKEQITYLVDNAAELLKKYNSIEGVEAKIEKIDSTSIKDILSATVTTSNYKTLIENGILTTQDKNAVAISIEQSVKQYEEIGFTCTYK